MNKRKYSTKMETIFFALILIHLTQIVILELRSGNKNKSQKNKNS